MERRVESFQKRERNRRSIQRRQDKEFRRKQRADDKKHGRSPAISNPTLDPMAGDAAPPAPEVPNASAPATPPKEQRQ